METLEILYQHLLDEDIITDFEKHLEEIVSERFDKFSNEFVGKHFYSLKITKTLTRTNYHQFEFEKLQEISRKLTNGMTTLGTFTNRKFWNRYFVGGVRTISIGQEDSNEYPFFTLNYILFSDIDNLDVRIKSQLNSRVKMIDSSLSCLLEYIGDSYDKSILDQHLDFKTNVNLESHPITKLGTKTIDNIILNPLQRPRFFGKLFKIKNQYETINN